MGRRPQQVANLLVAQRHKITPEVLQYRIECLLLHPWECLVKLRKAAFIAGDVAHDFDMLELELSQLHYDASIEKISQILCDYLRDLVVALEQAFDIGNLYVNTSHRE